MLAMWFRTAENIISILQKRPIRIWPLKIQEIFDSVVLVTSKGFGSGDDDLGDILMKGYFYTLSEGDTFPKAVIFLNGGVHLTVEGSPILKDLKNLETKGVEILSCGTCLDFYGFSSNLAVGGISNMYTIVEHMNAAKKVVRL